MRLLPIIIIVSILGFFLAITLAVCACRYMKVRARRQSPSTMLDNGKPVRQLTVRKGKIVSISQAVPVVTTKELRSPDLGAVRPGNSLKSKFWQTGRLQTAPAANFYNLRRSSRSTDLEAQSESSDTWEVNVGTLRQLEKQFPERRYSLNSPHADTGRSISTSCRKITTSLKKAYKGTPFLETEIIEIPSTLGSKPARIRTLVRKTSRSTAVVKSSDHGLGKTRSLDFTPVEEPREQASTAYSTPRDLPADTIGLAVSTDSIHFIPPIFLDSRRPSLPRLITIPNDSLGTFRSSVSSSTWTFGNAQPVPILASVMPPAPARTAARRPRSKYGRYPRLRHEKELPVLPRPP